jgi:hypothetical protein
MASSVLPELLFRLVRILGSPLVDETLSSRQLTFRLTRFLDALALTLCYHMALLKTPALLPGAG